MLYANALVRCGYRALFLTRLEETTSLLLLYIYKNKYKCYHENNVPLGYHHNVFVATHALAHMMYGYTLLVPMNQRVLSKLSKEFDISGHK